MMFSSLDMETLSARLMTTLSPEKSRVRFATKIPSGYLTTTFTKMRSGHLTFRISEGVLPEDVLSTQISGRRVFVVRKDGDRECFFPVLSGGFCLGWVGVPLPSLHYWESHARGKWLSWIRDFSIRTAVREGLSPEDDGPVYSHRSLMRQASRLSHEGEEFGIVSYSPHRPEMAESSADLFHSIVRMGDLVGVSDARATALCLRGGPDGMRHRLLSILSDVVEYDWRFSGEMRFGFWSEGRIKATSILTFRPSGRVVTESKSNRIDLFRRMGL